MVQTPTIARTPQALRIRTKPAAISLSRLMPAIVLVILVAAITVVEPQFIGGGGIRIMLVQCLPLLFLACGQMLVMLLGGIDLSNAAMGVLAAVLVASWLGPLGWLAPVLTLLVVAAIGSLSGWLSGYFQVPTFAVTLGAMGVWQAAALLISDQTTVSINQNLEIIGWVLDVRFLGLEAGVWLGALIVAGIWFMTSRTSLGQELKAVGLNERTAILSGISNLKARTLVHCASGFLAGLAGLILTAQQGTATATGAGVGLLLPSIAAAIIGGCAVAGGISRPVNVAFGACIVTLVPIGAAAIGIDPRIQYVVFGLIIVLAVAASIDRSSRTPVY